MLRYIALLSLLLASLLTPAQTVLRGRVVDAENQNPLAYAQVRLLQAGGGIISNEEGRFVLKLPADAQRDTLMVSYVGYRRVMLPLAGQATDREWQIGLEAAGVTLDSVQINPVAAAELLRRALAAVPANYHSQPIMAEAFYRELIQQGGEYTEISEAVLELYQQSPGTAPREDVQVRLIKGRHRNAPQPFERINIGMGGGHAQRLAGAAVTGQPTSYHFLQEKYFRLYDYNIVGTTRYEGRDVWVIEFDQAKKLRKRLYQGTIYLDLRSLAFALIEYRPSDQGKKYRMSQVVSLGQRAQLAMAAALGYKFRFTGDRGRVAATRQQGAWYLNHVSYEMAAEVETPQLEGDTPVPVRAAWEMVFTDLQHDRPAAPIEAQHRLSTALTLEEQVGTYDAHFWESYQHLELSQELQAVFE